MNATINKSADVTRSATKCNGDMSAPSEHYIGKKTCNHHGQNNIFGQKYLHSISQLSYVDIYKHNYDKHVERMENWKDISEKEKWSDKAGLVILFLIN